jgi:phosphatidylinositol alpha-1,6-mannosyltransferase
LTGAPILLVTNMAPPLIGGTATVYDRVARHAGGRVHVLTASRDPGEGRPIPGWRASDALRDYPISRLPWLRPPMIERVRRRIGLLDLLLIDLPVMVFVVLAVIVTALRIGARTIVIGELQGLGWLAILLGRITPWRIAIYTHGEEVVQRTYNRLARLRGPALRSADIVITVSRFTRDHLIADFGVSPDAIRLVVSGVDLDRFTPADPPQRDPLILGAGRLIERKGFDRLIDAFALVAADFPDHRLAIAGDGPDGPAFRARAAASPVADRIDFLGKLSDADLLAAYRRCALFAMPNRTLPDGDTEGFGLTFIEAGACGKPVVGGRAGGATGAIVDGETGLLVDGTDVQAIADGITRILSDPMLYDRLAAGGLAQAQTLTWDATTRAFIEIAN